MTIEELTALANELGIDVPADATEADVYALLEAHKEALFAKAFVLGIDVPPGANAADIEALIAAADADTVPVGNSDQVPVDDTADVAAKGGRKKKSPGVVPSPEKQPLGGPDVLDDPEAIAASADPNVDPVEAEHHHQSSLGPELTPAGAHRHGPGQPEHVHIIPPHPGGPDVVIPVPNPDSDSEAVPETQAVTAVSNIEQSVVFDSQLVQLKAGQKVTGAIARYLLDTGADVTEAG